MNFSINRYHTRIRRYLEFVETPFEITQRAILASKFARNQSILAIPICMPL